MAKIKIHDLKRISSYIQKDLDKAYHNTLDESCYLRGSAVQEFEQQWKEYTGAEDCCALTPLQEDAELKQLLATTNGY